MFVLYLVKTSDVSERTVRRRPLSVHLVIEPESCNLFKILFKLLTFQLLSQNLRINFLPPKTLNLHKFSIKMRTLGASDLVWSASACHRRGNRPLGVDGCTPVWELMDETSNTCSNNMNVTWQLSDVTIYLLCGDFVFDALGLLYAVKVVPRFYTVQYEHMKRDVVACAFVFVPNFLQYVSDKNWQNWMTSDLVITNMKRWRLFWDTVYARCPRIHIRLGRQSAENSGRWL